MSKYNSDIEIASNHITVYPSPNLLEEEDVDYKALYYFLFNGISDVLALNEKRVDSTCDTAKSRTADALKKLQCQAEDFFLNQMN